MHSFIIFCSYFCVLFLSFIYRYRVYVFSIGLLFLPNTDKRSGFSRIPLIGFHWNKSTSLPGGIPMSPGPCWC